MQPSRLPSVCQDLMHLNLVWCRESRKYFTMDKNVLNIWQDPRNCWCFNENSRKPYTFFSAVDNHMVCGSVEIFRYSLVLLKQSLPLTLRQLCKKFHFLSNFFTFVTIKQLSVRVLQHHDLFHRENHKSHEYQSASGWWLFIWVLRLLGWVNALPHTLQRYLYFSS